MNLYIYKLNIKNLLQPSKPIDFGYEYILELSGKIMWIGYLVSRKLIETPLSPIIVQEVAEPENLEDQFVKSSLEEEIKYDSIPEECSSKDRVFFLKTHKTASSVIENIMFRSVGKSKARVYFWLSDMAKNSTKLLRCQMTAAWFSSTKCHSKNKWCIVRVLNLSEVYRFWSIFKTLVNSEPFRRLPRHPGYNFWYLLIWIQIQCWVQIRERK